MFIELVRLKHGDSDLDELIRIHQEPSVSRFLSTSDNYFKYINKFKELENYLFNKLFTNYKKEKEFKSISLKFRKGNN